MGSASSPAEPLWKAGTAVDTEVRKQVRGVISALLYGQDGAAERRRQVRYAFPQPVYLTALGADGITPEGEAMVAVGKDLSENGLGFYHPGPLPSRRMIVSLETGDGQWLAFVIEVHRCRPIRQGWYESGGRFLQPVPSPMAAADACPTAGREQQI